MHLFTGFLIFVIGICTGSFLSATIYRMKSGDSLVKGRSKCPKCETQLKAKNLIPLLSYTFQKGKCSACKERISVHYPLLELLTGLTFAAIFFKFGPTTLTVFYIIISAFLIAIFFEDALHREISNEFVVPATTFAMISIFMIQNISLVNAAIALTIPTIFFGLQILISKGKWIGGGDLKLGVLMGIFLGWELLLVALIASYFIGAILGVSLLATKKAKRNTQIAFGPILVAGTFIALFYGNVIINWYLELILFA
jgi:leader peptidase (prepilin peptidase) / N-methyltransferase